MTPEISAALDIDMIVDITTRGRKSGQPRRIEIWSHYFDGKVIVAGSPGKRGWHANLIAEPRFVYHIKHGIKVDLPSVARPIRDATERRAILTRLVELSKFRQEQGVKDLEEWVASSPLVEVQFELQQ